LISRLPRGANAIALALAFLAFLGGCGGDADDHGVIASDYDDVIVKADFIQAATEACESRTAQIRAQGQRIYKAAASKPEAAIARELVDKVIAPNFEGQLEDLRALDPPSGEEEDVEIVIDEIEGMLNRMKEGKTVGRTAPYRKSENYAAAYGLPACGHP
jgi:hypothetical protein